jgi:hypothetical protein
MERMTTRDLELEVFLASLKSHEKHIKYIYGLRWGALALSFLTIVIGAIMVFRGLSGSFNWAVGAPYSVGAKLTNASPGIVFATVGMVIGFVVILQKPVNYDTGERGRILERLNRKGVTLTASEVARLGEQHPAERGASGITLGPS